MDIFDRVYVTACSGSAHGLYCYYHTDDYFEGRDDQQKFFKFPLLWTKLVRSTVLPYCPDKVWVCFDKTNGHDFDYWGYLWVSRTREDARELYRSMHNVGVPRLTSPRKYYMV